MLILIVQIGVVLTVARLVGFAFRRIGQPQVVGEMAAGICLGPSVLGALAPGASAALFPPDSLGYLNALSQAGLLLFMFLIGVELEPALLRGRGRTAVFTSHVGIALPFLLGFLLAFHLYPRVSSAEVAFTGFALFMGAAMSITAFPVLARILAEHNLLRSRVGALTIACAAVDDVTAWCLLAVVVGLVRAGGVDHSLAVTLGGALLFAGAMVTAGRALLRRLDAVYAARGRLTQDLLALILVCLLVSAGITEWLGIHALFGAFLFGASLPKTSNLGRELRERLEDVTVVFLLPLFFAFTGLRTQVGLIAGPAQWLDAGLIVLTAIAGKLGGSALAARATGLDWREATALGVLMNTRGLMELVILSIGLDLGVISPTLFTMMVLMALVTTFMTSPLLAWIYPQEPVAPRAPAPRADASTVLIAVAAAASGPPLLQAALALVPAARMRVIALHLREAGERSILSGDAAPLDDDALAPLLATAAAHDVAVQPLSFFSRDLGRDIAAAARDGAADLVLVGWRQPPTRRALPGATLTSLLEETAAVVAIHVARAPRPWRRVVARCDGGPDDRAVLALARRLAATDGVRVSVAHPSTAPPRLAADETGRLALRRVDGDDAQVLSQLAADADLVLLGAPTPAALAARLAQLADSPAALLMVYDGAADRA